MLAKRDKSLVEMPYFEKSPKKHPGIIFCETEKLRKGKQDFCHPGLAQSLQSACLVTEFPENYISKLHFEINKLSKDFIFEN